MKTLGYQSKRDEDYWNRRTTARRRTFTVSKEDINWKKVLIIGTTILILSIIIFNWKAIWNALTETVSMILILLFKIFILIVLFEILWKFIFPNHRWRR